MLDQQLIETYMAHITNEMPRHSDLELAQAMRTIVKGLNRLVTQALGRELVVQFTVKDVAGANELYHPMISANVMVEVE